MGSKPPTAAEAAQLGLTLDEALAAYREKQEAEAVEVWPDNWPAVCLFERVATQWRMGVALAKDGKSLASCQVSLDYSPLFRLMDRMDLRRDEWDQLFDDVRVLEDAALEKMREDRQQ